MKKWIVTNQWITNVSLAGFSKKAIQHVHVCSLCKVPSTLPINYNYARTVLRHVANTMELRQTERTNERVLSITNNLIWTHDGVSHEVSPSQTQNRQAATWPDQLGENPEQTKGQTGRQRWSGRADRQTDRQTCREQPVSHSREQNTPRGIQMMKRRGFATNSRCKRVRAHTGEEKKI